jgi:parallel beta-helix repeat protein
MKRLIHSRPRRLFQCSGLVCSAFAVVAFLVPGSGQAIATDVSCGATITTNTKLDSDLANCPTNGIVIGADNITLDLNGHTVGGDGVPVPSCDDGALCDLGIENSAGHAGVTIKGGSVRGFDVGILVLGASRNRIHGLASASNSSFGMIVEESTESRIDHYSSVDDGISGILMLESNSSRIEHNSVAGAHGYGIPLFGSSHNRIEENVLDGNDHGILLDSSNDNEVRANRIYHSGGSSIDIGHASENRVEKNILADNGDGVILFEADGNQISDNSVMRTGFFGFPDTGGFGVILDGADDNLMQRNVVTGGKGPAFLVTSLDSQGTSDRNVVSHNVANSKLSDGIVVDGSATATLLERNTANRNGADGIDVHAVGTTVTLNTANLNHDLGIEAVWGVIDGGGNRASGNGNPLQCTNVTCS